MNLLLADITLTGEQLAAITGGVGVLLAGVGYLLKAIQATYSRRAVDSDKEIDRLTKQNTEQQAQLDEQNRKIREAWKFQMQRAEVEAVQIKKERSDEMPATCDETSTAITLDTIPRETLASIMVKAPDLREMYQKNLSDMSDDDARLELQAHFGLWLKDNVCIPHNHKHGECLVYALLVAKDSAMAVHV